MITVLGDRVLVAVQPAPDEVVSDGGIVLAHDPDRLKTPTQGLVVALGHRSGCISIDDAIDRFPVDGPDDTLTVDEIRTALKALRPCPFDVAVGDCVLFPRYAGEQVTEAGVDYVILFESDILGVVPELSSEAA